MNALALPLLSAMLIFLSLPGAAATEPPPAASADLIEIGRKIYEEGILPNGEPLAGTREGGTVVSGADAACINCHRRSGMGATEGLNFVPPVIGPALFEKFTKRPVRKHGQARGVEWRDATWRGRPPYSVETLTRAIREGVSPTGYRFQYLMPRYALSEGEMKSLIVYLRTLFAQPAPGVETDSVHFATVVAPGVDAAARKTSLEVLKACLAERSPAGDGQAPVKSGAGRNWRLHVWELEGPADTWEIQLRQRYNEQPVFALVSGLGRDEWAPVHRFCEQDRIPCLFPNTDIPGSADNGIYNFYFSRGVILEAQALAQYLAEQRDGLGIGRVVQVRRDEGAGAAAAAALRKALANSAIQVRDVPFPPPPLASDADKDPLLADLGPADALVLWLREADVAHLVQRLPSPPEGTVVASGILGGMEQIPLSAPWRKLARITYPVDAPGRWQLRSRYNLRPWLSRHGIAPADERLQGNTLAACATLSEAMYRLKGTFYREYLLETTEYAASAMGNTGASVAFPRFIIGTNQRFASKGAYIVRFSGPEGGSIAKDSEWITP